MKGRKAKKNGSGSLLPTAGAKGGVRVLFLNSGALALTSSEQAVPSRANPEASNTFGFEFMDEKVDEFAASQRSALPGPWERWSLVIGFLGAGLGMLLGVLLDGNSSAIAAAAGLAIEIAGFSLSIALMVKREWHAFRHAKRSYARDLDKDFEAYQRYVGELRGFPKIDRERRLRYILDRRRVLQQRLGLFSGGLERLGVLPIIVALYFQFRDWEWGDWSMLAEVNLVQGLLIWTLLLGYAASWYLIRLHARAEAYELLLREASQQDEECIQQRAESA